MKKKRGLLAVSVAILCVLVLAGLFSGKILWSLGAVLDSGEPPQKADVIVVIGGDWRGNRILKAAELARAGYAPRVLVSGLGGVYGHHESDLAIEFAIRHGYPREMFVAFHYPAVSTRTEAVADIRELRRLGVHKYLLVTSIWHTARAERIFRREGRDLEVHAISSPDRYWQNGEWWVDREGRKIWFDEAVRTVADYFGI
jgi:uncharacterized SAM-binding protein YcdF (DUF218 family)